MFADIIVDLSVEALDRTFQYIIPKQWEGEVFAGCCVKIPFGRGNRLIRVCNEYNGSGGMAG